MQIFAHVYHASHFSLVVVDLEKCCFRCLDSLPGDKKSPAEVKVIANMHKYSTEKFGISGVCKRIAATISDIKWVKF